MSSKREQFEIAQKQGFRIPELEDNEPPEFTLYIWNIFVKLQNSGGFSISALDAYCRLVGLQLTSFEVDILVELSNVYWSVHNE